jgi:hypothetical protein
MGNQQSQFHYTPYRDVELSYLLANFWNLFVYEYCELRPGVYTPLQVVEAAFTSYLEYNHIFEENTKQYDRLKAVHKNMRNLIKQTKTLTLSPGWVCECFHIDTRLVLGIKVITIPKLVYNPD